MKNFDIRDGLQLFPQDCCTDADTEHFKMTERAKDLKELFP